MAAQADPGIIFQLNKAVLRSQRRVLRWALACYLAAGLAMTTVAIWAAIRPASVIAPVLTGAVLIAIGAVQVDYHVVVVVVQLWLTGRDLRRAGSAVGRLTLDRDGLDDGLRRIAWDQVIRVRVRRDRVPHVAVTWRRVARSRRRVTALRPAWYNVSLDVMAEAFERFVPIEVKARPRTPAVDEPPGTITFFVNLIGLQARRDRYLLSLVTLLAMIGPAVAGLFLAGQPVLASVLLALAVLLVIRHQRKLASLKRPLSLNRDGLGRLELTPEHVTLAGTKHPIPWSHIRDAIACGNGRSGLSGVIACPGPEPESSCRFGNRTIKFRIDEALYNTTTDDLVAAFARYTPVAPLDENLLPLWDCWRYGNRLHR